MHGILNIPIADHLAVRVVVCEDHLAGFINAVARVGLKASVHQRLASPRLRAEHCGGAMSEKRDDRQRTDGARAGGARTFEAGTDARLDFERVCASFLAQRERFVQRQGAAAAQGPVADVAQGVGGARAGDRGRECAMPIEGSGGTAEGTAALPARRRDGTGERGFPLRPGDGSAHGRRSRGGRGQSRCGDRGPSGRWRGLLCPFGPATAERGQQPRRQPRGGARAPDA